MHFPTAVGNDGKTSDIADLTVARDVGFGQFTRYADGRSWPTVGAVQFNFRNAEALCL